MKLFFSPNSPYARKARVTALEKGVEMEFVSVDPWANSPDLLAASPLGTVPALATDEGFALCDSGVICEYLDSLSPKTPLIPREPDARFRLLASATLAEGMIDAGVSCAIEKFRRPEDKQWQGWIDRKQAVILRALENINVPKTGEVSLLTITLACALEYIDFRFPQLEWRGKHPAIAAWLAEFSARPSMRATKPVG